MNTSADGNPGCNQERCTGITPNTVRYTGKVKWYDAVKGFGFITSDSGEDVFVYLINIYTSKEDKRRPVLIAGETVEYSVFNAPKGLDAREVSLPGGIAFPSRLYSEACDSKKQTALLESTEESSNNHLHSVPNSKKRSRTSKISSGSPWTGVPKGQSPQRESTNSSVPLSSHFPVSSSQLDHYSIPYHRRPDYSLRGDSASENITVRPIQDEFIPGSIIGNMSLPFDGHRYFPQDYAVPVQPFFPGRGQNRVVNGNYSISIGPSETSSIYQRVPFEDCYCASYSGVSTQNHEHSAYVLPYNSPYPDSAFQNNSRILFSANDVSQSPQFYFQSQQSGNPPCDYGKHYGPSKSVISQRLHDRQRNFRNSDAYYGRQF